jgi:hypothetical protein
MIDTYNQFPEAYQVAVVVVCGHLSNRIFHMLWMVIVAFAIKKLQTRVMYLQEIYPEKLCQPTVMRAAISSNGPRLSRIFIHGKAIDKMTWQTPALLRMRSWRIVLEIYDCWSSALIRATSVASRSICSRLLTASSPTLFSPFFRCRSSKASLPFKILVTISPALTWLNG